MTAALAMGGAMAAAAALAAGGAAYASFYPTSQIFGRVLTAGRDPRQIALTYDDGPNPSATPQLLELLAKRGVKASFFLIGSFAAKEPALARSIASEGHVIGNHTMTHPSLAWQSASRIRQELSDANRALEDVLGLPVRFFRPPFGARRPYVMRVARELGLETVLWNVTGHDWTQVGAEAVVARVQRGLVRNARRGVGSNVLLHDGGHTGPGADRLQTIEATDRIVAREGRDRFVTLETLSGSRQR